MGSGCCTAAQASSPEIVYKPGEKSPPADKRTVADVGDVKADPSDDLSKHTSLEAVSSELPSGHGHFSFWAEAAQVSHFMVAESPYQELLHAAVDGKSLPPAVEASICKDVPRTFFSGQPPPEGEDFETLGRVLRVLAFWDPELAYCQGVNFAAAFALRAWSVESDGTNSSEPPRGRSEEESFWLVACLMRQYGARWFFLHHTPLLKLYGFCLSRLLERHLPEMHRILEGLDAVLGFKWFGTIFTTVLPFEVAMRAWDMLFRDGLVALLRLALGLCFLLAPALLAAEREGEEAVETMGRLQRQLSVDAAPLLRPPQPGMGAGDRCKGVGADEMDVNEQSAGQLAGNRLMAAAESFEFSLGELEVLLLAWKNERPGDAADLGEGFSFLEVDHDSANNLLT